MIDLKKIYLLFLVLSVLPAYSQEMKDFSSDEQLVCKTIGEANLYLHIFYPLKHGSTEECTAGVFFHGVGWRRGSSTQFYPQCEHPASRGLVAISADYRINNSRRECVKDGKSAAFRWIRQDVNKLGINADKVIAGGGYAGGHVAAATGTTKAFNGADEDTSISCIPNALVLFNPVFDNGLGGYGYQKAKRNWKDMSPIYNINKNTLPAIIFLSTKNKLIPVTTAEKYEKLIEDIGIRCDLHLYKDQSYGFFSYKKGLKFYIKTLIELNRFLEWLEYLKGDQKLMNGLSAHQNHSIFHVLQEDRHSVNKTRYQIHC